MNSSTLNGAVMYSQGNLFEQQVTDWDSKIHKNNPIAIDAHFLSNHDTDRSAQYFQTLTSQKMAASAYLFLPGNPFIYYGEELGMTGNGIDQKKRLPMQWNTTGQDSPAALVGSTETVSTDGGPVATQESNPQSLLNWYKKILRLKAKYPQIASSRISAVDESNSDLSVVNYGKDLTIINNFSSNQKATFKIPKGTVGKKLADNLVVSGAKVSLSNDELVMPAYSTVILKNKCCQH